MAEKTKMSKTRKSTIILSAVSAVIAAALIITNFFVPVKYLASYLVAKNAAPEGVMRVRFIDVGYGDCTVIELPDGKNMLIDAGDGAGKHQSAILKYLNKSGISTIDYLICTSVNAERCGGLAEIMRYKKVKKIYMPYCINAAVTDEYLGFTVAAKRSGAALAISEYGAGEEFDGGFFRILSPSAHTLEDGEYAALNSADSPLTARYDASAVVWLEYAGRAVLFTGDAGKDVLEKIVSAYILNGENYLVNAEHCAIVKLGNHGAERSVSQNFYNTFKAEAAVISVGENGRGNPSSAALTNIIPHVGDNLYRTDERGTVTVDITAAGYKFI